MKTDIDKVDVILAMLQNNIAEKKPFSLIRFGDGGLKMMNSVSNENIKNIHIIGKKEGIPTKHMKMVIDLWVKYANQSDYIDTPKVYDNIYFWGRFKKNYIPINKGTQQLLYDWEKVYNRIGIKTKNRSFCNPEFNWLSILNNQYNLCDLMKDKKICFISIFDKLPRLSKYDITYKKVVAHYENQFKNSFPNIMDYIEKNANEYDLWLNSSGELGRLYSGRIRELGGRVLDMGFVAQYWNNFERPTRFNKFIEPDLSNSLCMTLTMLGKQFEENI